jgi:hypothetical protein
MEKQDLLKLLQEIGEEEQRNSAMIYFNKFCVYHNILPGQQ